MKYTTGEFLYYDAISGYKVRNMKLVVNQMNEYLKDKDNGIDEMGLFILAKSYDKLGKTEEAKKIYKTILTMNPNNKRAVLELGRVYVKEYDADNAEKEFKKYIKLDNDKTPHARLELGKLYAGMKRYDEGEEELQKSIKIDRDKTPHARLELGKLYEKQGRVYDAENEFKISAVIDKDQHTYCHFELGKLYKNDGKFSEAEEQYKKCISIEENINKSRKKKNYNPFILLELAKLYESEERYDEAENLLNEALLYDEEYRTNTKIELRKIAEIRQRDAQLKQSIKEAKHVGSWRDLFKRRKPKEINSKTKSTKDTPVR